MPKSPELPDQGDSVYAARVAAVADTFRDASIFCSADWTTLAEKALDAADAVEREGLRDALEDAVRRAYCEPIIPVREGEDADAIRVGTVARVLGNPDVMRHMTGIQGAVWRVLQESRDALDEERADG